MFINCTHCGTLVATDPATDLPPGRCPRCRGLLRSAATPSPVSMARLLRTPQAVEDTEPQSGDVPAVPAPAPPPQAGFAIDMPTGPTPPADAAPQSDALMPDAVTDAAAGTAPTSPSAEPPMTMQDTDTAAATPAGHVASSVPSASPAIAAPTPRPSPSFVRRRAGTDAGPHARRQTRWLIAAAGALSLSLCVQILLADRARLARDPGWRPLLTTLCTALRCSLPPWREPAALTVLARDVRPDPSRADVLLATATFRNDARWAQAWPQLRLTLSDIDGRDVGSRVFTAADYLGAPPGAATLAAGDSAQVRLALHEPDARAVSFAFDFD